MRTDSQLVDRQTCLLKALRRSPSVHRRAKWLLLDAAQPLREKGIYLLSGCRLTGASGESQLASCPAAYSSTLRRPIAPDRPVDWTMLDSI